MHNMEKLKKYYKDIDDTDEMREIALTDQIITNTLKNKNLTEEQLRNMYITHGPQRMERIIEDFLTREEAQRVYNIIYIPIDIFKEDTQMLVQIGLRGNGKTTTSFKEIIEHIIRGEFNEKFIFVRTTAEEMKLQKLQTVPNWQNNSQDDYKIIVNNFKEFILKYNDGRSYKIGKALNMTDEEEVKGVNFNEENFTIMMWDEAMKRDQTRKEQRELFDKFINLRQTVFRRNNKTKTIVIGNTYSIDHPFFNHYEVDMDILRDKGEYIRKIPTTDQFGRPTNYTIKFEYDQRDLTWLNKGSLEFEMFKDTQIGTHIYQGEFYEDDKAFIKRRPGDLKIYGRLKHNGETIGIWKNENEVHISSDKYDINNNKIITIATTKDDHDETTAYFPNIRQAPQYIINLKAQITAGIVYYDNTTSKNIAYETFKSMGIITK